MKQFIKDAFRFCRECWPIVLMWAMGVVLFLIGLTEQLLRIRYWWRH